jgi:putrescine aminotransferase
MQISRSLPGDTWEYFDTYVSPGWLKYRKSVSTNAAVFGVEGLWRLLLWINGEELLTVGVFGIYTCGHRNLEIIETVKAQFRSSGSPFSGAIGSLRGYLAKAVADIHRD